MTVQVPTRLDDDEAARLDELVRSGVGTSRSHVIRVALDELYDRRRRAEIAAQIVLSYTTVPQDADDAEWADGSAADFFGDRR
jgi:Arc/MetJ-type ribon-helix-helix transcriptional regulator